MANLKFSLVEKINRKMHVEAVKYRAKKDCLELIRKEKAKKILIMNSSPFIAGMFKQRSHHIAELIADSFDIVLYYAPSVETVQNWKENIWLTKWLPDVKIPNVDVFYYITSVNSYPFWKIKRNIKNGYKLIYDYMDEMTSDLAFSNDIKLLWDNLSKLNPALVIASSDRLYKNLETKHPRVHKLLAKNGATVEHFSVEKDFDCIPDDLKNIVNLGKPIVGYYGYLASWIDVELLNKAAAQRPDYNFVYIGKDFRVGASTLEMFDNVFFLGRKPYEILPQYGVWFDCATIPFRQGDIAKATSPVKLFEYMALKKPVICTKDLKECYGYDGVLIAENDDDFIQKLDKAIELSKDENIQRILFEQAQKESWKSRVDAIKKELNF